MYVTLVALLHVFCCLSVILHLIKFSNKKKVLEKSITLAVDYMGLEDEQHRNKNTSSCLTNVYWMLETKEQN